MQPTPLSAQQALYELTRTGGTRGDFCQFCVIHSGFNRVLTSQVRVGPWCTLCFSTDQEPLLDRGLFCLCNLSTTSGISLRPPSPSLRDEA